MPSFGIGINSGRRDSGGIKGKEYQIACKAMFIPNKVPLPTMFKYEDQEGVIHTVNGVKVKSTNEKYYEESFAYEYICEADICNVRYVFKLVFFVIKCRWIMIL